MIFLILGCFMLKIFSTGCLDNGLALTPPMGWLAWERFKCNINCHKDPENCISEKLFMKMADIMVKEGYKDAGYVYVNIDDCWMAPKRDANGKMVADPERFPSGIKFLADYMHERGLKLGIYQDFGVKTCMGYPGIVGHMEQDANTFAEWEVDMVKLDGCHSEPEDMDEGYIRMGNYLNSTNRPMVYSCSWPYYQLVNEMEPNYELIAKHCNMWRTFHDIKDSWESVFATITFLSEDQDVLTSYVGPGRWNDPDMLMIGNFHLTAGQARIQMGVWCVLPAPLLMSNDLRHIDEESKEILLNVEAIAINQDPLGLPGKRVYLEEKTEVWSRPISPIIDGEPSYAVLFINRKKYGTNIKVSLAQVLPNTTSYTVTIMFHAIVESKLPSRIIAPGDVFEVGIPGMDAILLNCRVIKSDAK